MEVTILDAANLPTKAILAINTGSIRGQVKPEVNQPFVVASSGSTSSVEVALFQQMGTRLMVDEGQNEAHCCIPFRRADGINSKVQLQIRRKHQDTCSISGGSPGQELATMATGYLAKHKLRERCENLIQDVLREQPDDPYKCMLEALKRARSAAPQSNTAIVKEFPGKEACKNEGGNSSEQEMLSKKACSKADGCDILPPTVPQQPLVPHPPAGPAPARKGRPLIGTHKTTTTSGCVCTGCPRKEAVSLARISITMVMKSPSVQRAAQDSIRDAVRKESAQRLATHILTNACTRVAAKEKDLDHPSVLTRVVIRNVLETCSIYASKEYQQALARFTVLMSLKGAAKLMASQEHLRSANFRLEDGRRRSLPTPIVSLCAEQSWGQWLAPRTR